jgi:ABC-type uncharacterized transport system YnjBCD substrate-binding protein
MEVNHSTAIFLMNKEVRAILCIYEADAKGKNGEDVLAPRHMFKTMDHGIKVGDLVVVPTNAKHGASINKVVDVDVEVDFESATAVPWIIDVVDKSLFEANSKKEAVAIEAIKFGQKRRKQDELREMLMKDNPELREAKAVLIDLKPSFSHPAAPPLPGGAPVYRQPEARIIDGDDKF